MGFLRQEYLKVSISRSVVPNSLWPHGLQPTKLLCPLDFPGKDTGVDCHFFLQGIFPTQGSNPHFLHCRQIIYQLSYKGRVGCYFVLQGIFLTQGSNPDLLHCRWILYHLSHQEALTNGKDNINISVVKTSSSVSMVKVNLKCSTTKQLKLKEGWWDLFWPSWFQ